MNEATPHDRHAPECIDL